MISTDFLNFMISRNSLNMNEKGCMKTLSKIFYREMTSVQSCHANGLRLWSCARDAQQVCDFRPRGRTSARFWEKQRNSIHSPRRDVKNLRPKRGHSCSDQILQTHHQWWAWSLAENKRHFTRNSPRYEKWDNNPWYSIQ